MPLRGGESVGRAYVRIYADGAEVPDDIRRMLEDAEPSVREAGKDHGRTYGEEFDKESRKTFKTKFGDTKKSMFHDLNEGLTDSISKIELSRRFFDGPEWKKFLRRLDDEFGDAGKLAGRRLEAEFRDSADLSNLSARMRQVGRDVRAAQADIIAALHEDAIRENRAFDARISAMNKERDIAFRESVRDNKAAIIQFRNNMREISAEIDKMEKGKSSFTHSRLNEMVADLRRLAPSLDLSQHQIGLFGDRLDVMHRKLGDVNPRLAVFNGHIDRTGTFMGRLFGKGSRNDFFNIFGSFVESLVRAPLRLLTGFAEGITKIGRSMADSFTGGGGGLRGTFDALMSGLAGVGAVGLKAGAAIAGFAAFLGLLSIVIGPVVAILSGLVGILLALSSSLIYAAASVAAFAPLVVPLGAIIAGVAAAVIDLKDAGGALGDTLTSIKDRASGLWERFKSGVGDSEGLHRVLKEVNRALGGMEPLVDAATRGFNRFANEIAEEMSGGAFDKFTDRFARFLPHAMKDLGTIMGNTFGGFAGLLRGAIPSANRLLDWLVDITDRFDKWANSKEGQKQIKKFLDDAADSAESVGDGIQGAWHWLTKLISKSKDEGDNLWERIGGKFQEWADWIDAHPDAFENWMKDADELATSIGDVVDGLNHIVDVLDSSQNRGLGNSFIGFIGTGLDALATSISWLEIANFYISESLSVIGQGFAALGKSVWYVLGGQWVGDLFHGMEVAIEGAGGFIAGIFTDLWDQITGAFSAMGSGGGGAMAIRPTLDLTGIANAITRLPGMVGPGIQGVVNRFQGLAGRVANAVGNVAGRVLERFSGIPARVQEVASQAVARWGNLAERINRGIGDLWRAISSRFTDIPGQVAGVVDDIVAAFRGLAGRILAMIGPIVIHPTIGSITGGGGGASGVKPGYGGDNTNSKSVAGDPAARMISSVSRGVAGVASAVAGRTIDASGWTVVTPSEDPRIVATEVLNELVAKAV